MFLGSPENAKFKISEIRVAPRNGENPLFCNSLAETGSIPTVRPARQSAIWRIFFRQARNACQMGVYSTRSESLGYSIVELLTPKFRNVSRHYNENSHFLETRSRDRRIKPLGSVGGRDKQAMHEQPCAGANSTHRDSADDEGACRTIRPPPAFDINELTGRS